jgi:uncharacterized protein (DUF1015 family)
MAEVQPFRALRYDLRAVGALDAVAAPPYDVIDDPLRAELAARSPFNVVEIDLPRADGGDPYLHAETTLEAWRQQGVVVRDREPAIWAMTQDYEVPGAGGRRLTRHGFFCRVRVEEYGQGRIRPHERTHPGPKEDRLRLTRATRANLSPIFSLFPDPELTAWSALEPLTERDPVAAATDGDGTTSRIWRVTEPEAIADVREVLGSRELLIADGHHRYETARTYADEIGGEGEHRYALMLLCSLSDPGLTVLATHRLLTGLDESKRSALRETIERDFEIEPVSAEDLQPAGASGPPTFGYIDRFHRRPHRLVLKDERATAAAMPDRPEAYRRLDAAVLEAIVLRGALDMSDDDIAHRRGLDYSSDEAEARAAVESGSRDAAFFMRPTPIEQVREAAAAGASMPPKSTFFYPKVPTGLVFNLLE